MQLHSFRNGAIGVALALSFTVPALLAAGDAGAAPAGPSQHAIPNRPPVLAPTPDPDTQYLLLRILDRLRAMEARLTPGTVTLSSGIFSLPANARSVDWQLLNNDTTPQTVTVTVYETWIGREKEVVAPGPVTVTLPPGHTTHNANSVPTIFQVGHSYEVVVTGGSPKVLPVVMVWSDMGNTVIPGTQIHAGEWMRVD